MSDRVKSLWMRPFVWLVLLSLGSAVLSAEPSFAQVNEAPRFPASETGTRQVAENTAAGMTVGGPVSAEDPDDTTLTYSLSGDDAARFDINSSSGQILTRSALDHETGASHEVTVTASDGTSDASIEVQIAVTNVDEPGTLTLSPSDTPRVGHVLRALVDDPDGYFNFSEVKWELTRDNGQTWTEINSRDSVSWVPDAFHEGARVRVAINYLDWQSSSSKRAQSDISEPIRAGNAALELAVTAYVSDVAFPWGLAFAPDGTLFFTERLGALKVRRTDGSVQQLEAHLSDLDFGYNAGFQDLILDRSFATNRRFGALMWSLHLLG